MYVTIYQFYDIKIIPSTYNIIEVTNLLIQAAFVESLRPKRGKRLSLYVFPILDVYTYTLYIYTLYTYIFTSLHYIIILLKRNTVYNNTGYNTRLLSRYCFACRTCTIHNPRSRLYHCTRESVYSAVYIYIYIYLCQMICSKTLSYVIWHIPSHSFGSRSDLEKFYVKWLFPGQSWKTNVRTNDIHKKQLCTNVIRQCQITYRQHINKF